MQQKLCQAKERWSCQKVFIFIESFQHLQYIRYFSFIIFVFIFFSKYLFFSFNKTLHCSALCVCVQRGKSVVGCGALVSEHFSGVGRFKKSFFYQFDFFEFLFFFLRIYLFAQKN